MMKNMLLLMLGSILTAGGTSVSANQDNKSQKSQIRSVKTESEPTQESTRTVSSRQQIDKSVLRPRTLIFKYNEPFDLIELIPVVRDINRLIPRQFSLASHQFVLNSHQMIIRHEILDYETHTSAKKSIISLSYTSSMGNDLGTRLDVPLFYSSVRGRSKWSRYPVGNYTMTINRDNPFANDGLLYIKALTRF